MSYEGSASPQSSVAKSTNVRAPWPERWLRGGFRSLGPWAPGPAARLAEVLFCTPPRGRSARVDAAVRTGRRRDIGRGKRRLAAWHWGSGPRMILLHGWGGRAGQLGAFVEPLVASGHEVVAFDAPGHGLSGGRFSSMVDFANALLAAQAELGPVHGVVAHSLGGAATTLALARGLRVQSAVFLGPPAGPVDWTRTFAERLAVPDTVMARMRARVEQRLRVSWSELDVVALAARQSAPLLLIHDEDDREVPFSDGRAIARAWPGARFQATRGLGHRRLLRDETVVGEVVSFVSHAAAVREPGRDRLSHTRPDSMARLERELFFRDSRGGSEAWG